ncbi:MAG: Flp pilus assembly complex ATPase component TadA, partial [Lachnospiraceae bacterium]|nr:Flp pilus assembly complex ATPase component TadA [Lachnospiraceae bacterium]
MMQSLVGVISSIEAGLIDEKTSLRFKDKTKFRTPEALIIHEQNIIPDDRLLEACQREYNLILETPVPRYVPTEVLQYFDKYNIVVIDQNVSEGSVTVGMLPEDRDQVIMSDRYKITRKLVPIYYYVELRTQQYGTPEFLAELPIKDKWEFIVNEALTLDASDITITNVHSGAKVYYNVRKTKVNSKRQLRPEDVGALANLLASGAKATMADESAKPRYFAIDINKQNRGRVVINKTYYGRLITIRVLPNTVLRKRLEDLGIEPNTCEFIRETVLSPEKGLRLFIGETMSGKNTTILSALSELVATDKYKIVSLEQPVEILVDGIEQINAETDEEFELNADSLLRQNPDIVYFTEITARTASSIMQQSNTAKAVFSSIHANSISDVLFRLQDITGLPIDRIILTLHSCVYQELVRDDRTDTVKPYNRCVYFDD